MGRATTPQVKAETGVSQNIAPPHLDGDLIW